MIIAVGLALLTTIVTASSNVLLKRAFSRISPFIAVYLSVVISTIFLWVATFLYVPRASFGNARVIFIFALIGIVTPALVRTLTYFGIHTLGAGRAAPLRAMTPFFAAPVAIFFLKEPFRPGLFLGIGLIVLGVALLSQGASRVSIKNKKFYLYPLGAAFFSGLAAALRKYGLQLMPQPIFCSTIASTTSMIVLSAYFFKKDFGMMKMRSLDRRAIRLIALAAFLTAIAEIACLSALLYGRVNLVVPILAATPLMIVLFSRFFLGEHETKAWRLILASLVVACGIGLIILVSR